MYGEKQGANASQWIGWGVLFVVVIGLLTAFIAVQPEKLDQNLCPENVSRNSRTILLVDASDPLTAKHRSELHRLLTELRTSPEPGATTKFYVEPGEELIVYRLEDNLDEIAPIARVCNPGDNPEEWEWTDDLTRGKSFAIKNWQQFEFALEGLFSKEESSSQSQSLILENIAVILPRHTRSSLQVNPRVEPRTHLIVFSDLLQNSASLSHYAPFPSAEFPSTDNFSGNAKLRELATDLIGVRVSLLRLERSKYGPFQTDIHYRWWANFIVKSGGLLHYQRSI